MHDEKNAHVCQLLKPDFFTVQISIKKAGYMDVKEITSPAVYMDMSAGDRSILRKVFGITSQAFPLCVEVYFSLTNNDS